MAWRHPVDLRFRGAVQPPVLKDPNAREIRIDRPSDRNFPVDPAVGLLPRQWNVGGTGENVLAGRRDRRKLVSRTTR